MDLTTLLGLVDGGTVVGGIAGSGGAVSLLGFMIRHWLKNQSETMTTLQQAVAASREEARGDVLSLKDDIHSEISNLKQAVEKQMIEFSTKISAQELELKHQDKYVSRLETRLALAEERGAQANQLRASFEDFREKTLNSMTALTGKTDALFEIAKGKRKLWDKDEEAKCAS